MGKYSDTLMDHFMAPRNSGALESPDVTGHAGTPGRGPFLILYLRITEGQVTAARFQTNGCGSTIACGSMLTEMLIGRSLEDCSRLTAQMLIESLDGVPADKLHSPALAIGALRDALKCYAPALLA
jgi:nitrogen fixation protein NifU and related proteins